MFDPNRSPTFDDIIQAKVVILGDVYVGKTCIFNRFVFNKYEEERTTMAASFRSKIITIPKES